MKKFQATSIDAQADENAEIPVYRVRLSDEADDTSYYLQFERQIYPDEQAIRLGFNRPHIEICDQGFSGYGLIESVVLSGNVLTTHFNKKGQRTMGLDNFKVSITPGLNLSDLKTLMKRILGDSFHEAENK